MELNFTPQLYEHLDMSGHFIFICILMCVTLLHYYLEQEVARRKELAASDCIIKILLHERLALLLNYVPVPPNAIGSPIATTDV
jgi:hypothetical protein